MRKRLSVIWLVMLVLGCAAEARAQQGFSTTIFGGASFPLGDAADRLDTGGSVGLGLGWGFHERAAVHLEYMYSGYGIDAPVLEDLTLTGIHNLHQLDLAGTFEVLLPRPIGVYVVGGPGLYYRRIALEEFTGETTIEPFCDPFLLICFNTAVPATTVVASKDDWNFGLNGGVGVRWLLADFLSIYLEGRYVYVWGSTFEDAQGNERDSDTQYLPVTFGFRYGFK